MSYQPDSSTTAILVVHGVGKPEPGATVDALVDSLAAQAPDFLRDGPAEIAALPDYDLDDSDVQRSFPCHLRRAHRGPERFVFAEVWWGKESAVRGGLLDTLHLVQELMTLVIGLRAIFQVDRPGDAPVTRWMTRSARWSSAMLVGPVYATNLVMLVALFAFSVFHRWNAAVAAPKESVWRSLLRWAPRPAPTEEVVWPWVVAVGVVTAVLAVCRLVVLGRRVGGTGLRAFPAGIRAEFQLRRLFWSVVLGLGCGMVFVAPWWRVGWSEYGHTLMRFVTWAYLGSAALLFLSILVFVASLFPRRPRLAAREAVVVTCALQNTLWIFLVPILWSALIHAIPDAWGGDKSLPDDLLSETQVSGGIHWILGGLIMAVSLVILVLRQFFFPRIRLIVPRVPSLLLLASCLVGIAFFTWTLLQGGGPRSGSGMASVPSPAIFGLLLLISPTVRIVLGLTDDVFAYIHKFTVAGKLFPGRPIRSRFRRVIEHLHSNESFEKLVIVAHSQGTMVVLDELALDKDDAVSRYGSSMREETYQAYTDLFNGRDVGLLTAGSPFTHLYQHYFPDQYPESGDGQWSPIRERLALWANVYREGDFVGREIEPLGAGENLPANHSLGAGGHMDYWSDRKFLGHLKEIFDALHRPEADPEPTESGEAL